MRQRRLTQFLSWKNIHTITGIGLFLFVTTIYASTMEATSSFWDSGEYIAASHKLQIPHPPGAPLFLLIGRMFSLTVGEFTSNTASALNLLSAVTSGLAVMFLFWSIIILAKRFFKEDSVTTTQQWLILGAGLVGSLSFGFIDTFWTSATETELYAFSTFITAFIFWAMLKWHGIRQEKLANKWLILICYVMGLSVGVHLLNLLTIPSLALIYYYKKHPNTSFKGILTTLAVSIAILAFVTNGLVMGANLAKSLEIYMVNQLSLPFGSGVILFMTLLVTALAYSLYFTEKKARVTANTVLLGLTFLIVGYSSYTVIPIRASYNTPINQNDPDTLPKMIYYLNMDQYPTRPLLYGQKFTSDLIDQVQGKPIYEIGEDQYEVKQHKIENIYDPRQNVLFPRMYSSIQKEHAEQYRSITGLKPSESPSMADNLYYLIKHQIGHMYLRYFMWNFAGRNGSIQGAGWLSPNDQLKVLPAALSVDKARNNYLMIPLLIGVIGFLFSFFRDRQQLFITSTLFIMTGLALVIYINAPPTEPRERDYIYIGSYYAFCLWLGLGTIGIYKMLTQYKPNFNPLWASVAIIIGLSSPIILFTENFNDHDRSERHYSIDQAKNLLASCAPNSILFTGGDNDTYPLWYAQEVEEFRTDVRVIVLSYANVDWYINQFYDQINDSAPLPLSLTKNNYKQGGLNDYLPYVPNAKVAGEINTNQLLRLIKNENKNLQVKSTFSELNIIPGKKFYTQVDTKAVLGRNIIPPNMEELLAKKMSFELKGKGLEKKDLVVMDLIDTNRWERPIYFNFTSLNSIALDLSKNVVQEGGTYRLLPISNPDPQEILINEDLMYENLVEKSTWRDLTNTTAFFDEYHKNFVANQRNTFNVLAQSLIDSGKYAKAKATLEKSMEAFPEEVIPFDYNAIRTTELLLALQDKDTADYITRKLITQSDELLEYLHTNDEPLYERKKTISLIQLRNLAAIYGKYGFDEEAQQFAQMFNRHYAFFNG